MTRILTLLVVVLAMGKAGAATPDWTAWDALLAAYVAPGAKNGVELNLVDYAGLGRDPRFAMVVNAIEQWPLSELDGREETLAFYINAYNVFAAKTVIEHLPVESIKDVGSVFKSVWKKPAGAIGGQVITLDDIEHERLRKMGEPRIHMAIVCASVSCPDLRTEAYRAERLDAQLDQQTQAFLDNTSKGLRLDGSTAHTTRIFDWFGEDFAAAGGVAAFIRRYHDLPEGTPIALDLPYDWSLNGR